MEFVLIVSFLPFVFLLVIGIQNMGKLGLSPIPNSYLILFVFIMAICMGLYPVEGVGDRERYAGMYIAIHDDTYWGEYKDLGWQYFMTFCTKIFGNSYQLFFLVVALIYSLTYYIFAKHVFGNFFGGYYIIMSFGCLGFINYGVITVRAGLALSILLIALCIDKKQYLRYILVLLSVTVHFSMILPIATYVASSFIKKDKYLYIIWLVCLILSIVNVDLSPMMEEATIMDERVDMYLNMEDANYVKGYRWDFLIYSVIPVIISYIYGKKYNLESQLYNHLYRYYIMTNAFWLLVIRMAYTNRIAYLSWVIIPCIILYPIIENKEKIKNSQSMIFRVMFLFMGVSLVLSIRDIFFKYDMFFK